MEVTIREDGVIPLPDELCDEVNFNVGDILLCDFNESSRSFKLSLYKDQTLDDKEIEAHGFLTRVEDVS